MFPFYSCSNFFTKNTTVNKDKKCKTVETYVWTITALSSNSTDEDKDVWMSDSGAIMHVRYRSALFIVAHDKILAAANKDSIFHSGRMKGCVTAT